MKKKVLKKRITFVFLVGFAVFFLSIKAIKQPTFKTKNEKWYYISSKPLTSPWITYNKKKYLVDLKKDNQMLVNWQQVGKDWYFIEGWKGVKKGWFDTNGHRYYLNLKNGKMVTGKVIIEGKQHFFNDLGQEQFKKE